MNHRLYRIQQSLGNIYRPLVILILTLLLFGIGYNNVKPKQYNLRVNQVSDVTIRAPYTTIDEEKTAENKQRAIETVADVYSYDSSIRERQMGIVEEFFSQIRKLKKEMFSTNQLKEWVGMINSQSLSIDNISNTRTDNQEVQFDQLTESEKMIVLEYYLTLVSEDTDHFAHNLDESIRQLFLTMNDEIIVQIQSFITNQIADLLQHEIAADKVNETKEIMNTKIKNEWNDHSIQEVTQAMLQQLIVPTVVYDAELTEIAKENAGNQVQSTYILQGQVIVQEGFVIEAEMMRILNHYGILDSQTQVYSIYAFAAVLVMHAIFLYIVFARWDNKQSLTVKDGNMRLTAYALSFLFSFMMLTVLQMIQSNGLKESILLFPAGMLPMLILPKTDRKIAILSVIFFNLIALFVLNNQTDILSVLLPSVFYFFSMLIAILKIDQERKQNQNTVQSSLLWHVVVIIPLLLALNFELFSKDTFKVIIYMLLSVLLTHLIVFLVQPYWEQLLNDRAELTLNQLANLNHPLLKKLIEEAPGTYHHSILVANLSANAVEAIGGDSLLTRVASYYHDVGKTSHPLFFVENLPSGMVSPHQMLTPLESAKIIIGHVTNGKKLLEEYEMPKSIVDVCMQHHGTTKAGYFYYQAKQENSTVDIKEFTYPGPIPQTKEVAVIMLADSVEAASRSLKEVTQESIEGLVTKIIETKISENQFADCGLTVHELKIVKQSLINGIAGMFHTRVEYPD